MATPLRPSLKRSREEQESGAANKSQKQTNQAAAGIQARQRFANGQLPIGVAASNAAAAAAVAGAQFAFPIPNISALVDDDESDYTSSGDGVSDLDDDDDVSVGPQHNFSRTTSVVTLTSSSSASMVAGGMRQQKVVVTRGVPSLAQRRAMLQKASLMSTSAPSLGILAAAEDVKPVPKADCATKKEEAKTEEAVKPDDYLLDRLQKNGIVARTVPSTEIKNFFRPVTEETVEGYDMDLVKKVREEDVDGLRGLMKSGRSMQCSNKFGESIVHMASRRGSLSVLEFLFNEANVSCRVCCDSGRTPLHDACWTSTPNFGVVRLLLDRCPDLLYITDKRGFTPLNYARRSHWSSWCDFLEKCQIDKLAAKHLWADDDAPTQMVG